jgi:hypothetical protein
VLNLRLVALSTTITRISSLAYQSTCLRKVVALDPSLRPLLQQYSTGCGTPLARAYRFAPPSYLAFRPTSLRRAVSIRAITLNGTDWPAAARQATSPKYNALH